MSEERVPYGKTEALKTKDSAEQLLIRQAEAQFALSTAGQMLKQFEIAQRMGQMFSQATIVPDVYKGNLANCAIAADMAIRMGMPPVAVMQNLYVVHGMPSWSSKFLIACINKTGRFTTLENHEKSNVAQSSDDYGVRCIAYAVDDVKKQTPLAGPWVTWKMVKAEGWLDRKGSKWQTMPDLMFRYRAAAMWQRLYAPEISMGLMTVEEAEDIQPTQVVDVNAVELESQPTPVVDERKIKNALMFLDQAKTAEEVMTVRNRYREVFDGNDTFHDALIDRYEALKAEEAALVDEAVDHSAPSEES